MPDRDYTQYDIDMFCKYGDWDDEEETGLLFDYYSAKKNKNLKKS